MMKIGRLIKIKVYDDSERTELWNNTLYKL